MKHAGSILSLNVPPAEHAPRRRIGRSNVFMRIIEALQYSRELEAARIHRRFGHLRAESPQMEPAIADPGSYQEEGHADASRDKAVLRAHRTLRPA
jgi:hypothetical protein